MNPIRISRLVVVPFRKKLTSAVLVAILVAFGFGVRKARAALSEIQPFTAIETNITRGVGLRVPMVYPRVLAVSGDGQLVAELQQGQFATSREYTRLVWNKREKTKISIDPDFKMIVVHPYHEDLSLTGASFVYEGGHMTAGPDCEGTPDGQIEGFDVNLSQPSVESSEAGRTITWKRWAAPKLGCYVLRDERLTTDKDGKFVSSNLRTISNIVIGEADPSYFDVSLPEGYRQVTPEEWMDAYVDRAKAERAQQPQ
jgi:hypothetical protein